MKRTRLLALLLAAVLLLLPTARAADTAEFVFPDNWSHDALVFAVENGILGGDQNHALNPDNNITRAEMAAVLVRLLGASERASLSAFRDVDANAWYNKELSAAYAAGIFGGVSENEMQPNAPITREQATTALCRAFGIVSDNRTAYQTFADGNAVSAYARDSVSAMKTLDFISGYGDGSFRPLAYITRAEVAQIIYNIFDCIADTPEEIPEEGWVLYRGSEPLPETLRLQGTLILGQTAPAVFQAAQWEISETLAVCTGKNTNADLRGLHAKRLVCAPLGGTVTSEIANVSLWGSGAAYRGDAATLTVLGGNHTYQGNSGVLSVRSGSLVHNGNTGEIELAKGTRLTLNGSGGNIRIGADNVSLSVNGRVGDITIDGKRVVVDGSGSAASITINKEGCKVTLSCDKLNDVWYETYQKDHDNAPKTVKTMRVPCTVLRDTALYKNQNLSGYICSLPAGTVVYNEWHPSGSVFYASLSDGTKGWIARWDCDIPDDAVTTDASLDYSKATKEGFVDLAGYDSATEYLVWVSRYTQKVIVFQGKKGDWELIHTFPCSSGANNTPTPEGIFTIYAHTSQWSYDYYYVRNVSIFNGGHAFHSILMGYNGGIYDDRVGIPLSHGCVRMLPDDCRYIYNLPTGTRVIIY